MAPLLKLIWASYQHNTLRLALVFIALVTACAGLSAVLVINSAAKNSYASASQPFLQQVEQRIIARSGHALSKEDFASLRRLGFSQLIPVLRTSQHIVHPITGGSLQISLLGIDTFSVINYSASNGLKLEQNSSEAVSDELGQLWRPPYASVIHPDFATELNLISGQILPLENTPLLPKLTVTKINGLGREIVMDIGQLQQVLGTDKISELLVVGETNDVSTSELRTALPDHLRLENINTGEQAQQLTGSFHLNLLAMACLMFVVCMFVVMNALHLLIMKRWQNLRILRQLGVSRKQIYWAQGAELVFISLLCAPLGAISGIFLAQLASPQVSLTLQSLFDVRISYTQVAYVTLIAQCFAACILGAFSAAILPMWQLNSKLALRNLNVTVNTSHRSWLYACIVLGCVALGLGFYSINMLMSFSAIAMSIFAGCSLLIYALPKSLNTLFHCLPEQWVLFRWLAADGVRLSQKSKIACCAFFIALTSNIGMNLMVDSFRQATQQWLGQRLVADQYISTQSPKVFTQWLATQDIDMQVIERKGLDAVLLNKPVSKPQHRTTLELRSYPSSNLYQEAMLFADQQEDVWQIFTSGQGVLVNQQLALRHGLTLGETLSFQVESAQPETKQIVGIYYDYGNQSAQALLPLEHFAKYNANTTLFALHFVSKQQQNLFVNQLASASISNQVRSIQTHELMALSMQTFERTFVITDGLNIVTLLVAALSLATSVLMIDMDNRPQRALLRSMGVGNYQMTGLSLIQYTLLSLLAFLVALPFGIGLTWLLINLINVQAFSWSYPILITPSKLFSAGVMSVMLIVIVVALPLYRLSRRKLVEDIKCLSF
ncbi:ABC transporter permease [Paraglaciecola sp. MB-3u-78]|uniref:ABC transporter permease n=1 Tax=Paraglaciecola sp. MB-3u-78 TaxID=2058332 RepID=UPI000C3344D4|nr:ABC transporter permease [Paraglaciecola sp. MB-3u-78]PKG92966.1 ABC transporter permease [Paraglaciecola sp. MB-3u-78]